MKPLTKLRVMLIAICASLIIVVACGGESSSQSNSTSTNSSGTSATAQSTLSIEEQTAAGQELFLASCGACHGMSGEGIDGLGKNLVSSAFTSGISDTELVDFVKKGRSISDPENSTGIDMPAKGGNPALSDSDLGAIVTYLRSIQQ